MKKFILTFLILIIGSSADACVLDAIIGFTEFNNNLYDWLVNYDKQPNKQPDLTNQVNTNTNNINTNTSNINSAIHSLSDVNDKVNINVDNINTNTNNINATSNKVNMQATQIKQNSDSINAERVRATNVESTLSKQIESVAKQANSPSVTDLYQQNQINDIDNRLDNVDDILRQQQGQIDDLNSKIEYGLASVAALTALTPNPNAKGNNQISVGTGMYCGKFAVAIGYFRKIGSRVMFNIGVAFSGENSTAGKMGVSFDF